MKGKCSYWHCANRIGLFLAMLFVICFVWFYINPAETDLHLRNLRLAFIGFSGMNFSSFLLGLVQSYVWAYVGVGIWSLIGCCLKSDKCEK